MQDLDHKHLIVRAEIDIPPHSTDYIEQWMIFLIDKIRMKRLLGPYSVYSQIPGNTGVTAVCIIETSHVIVHVFEEADCNVMQLDVYSCSDFSPEEVVSTLDVFKPSKVEYKFLDREHDLTLVEHKR